MSPKLEQALAIIRQMPDEEQDRYARLIFAYIKQLKESKNKEANEESEG